MMIGNRTTAEVDAFFNDLDTEELVTVLKLVKNADPLEMVDGKPKYDDDTIDLIQKFGDFVDFEDAEVALGSV